MTDKKGIYNKHLFQQVEKMLKSVVTFRMTIVYRFRFFCLWYCVMPFNLKEQQF